MTGRKPRFCCWVLNYRCMFRCRMCRIWDTPDAAQGELTLERKMEFLRSLDGFVERDFEIHLSGGEPLLTVGIFDLCREIAAKGYKSNMVTNGWLIDEGAARKLSESGLGTVTLSLDGFTSDTHDTVRGMPGSHARVKAAIDALARVGGGKKPQISLLTVIMERNLEEVEKLVDMVDADPRISMISFQAITQTFGEQRDDAWHASDTKGLWPRDPEKAARVMERLRERKLAGSKIGNQAGHFRHFRDYFRDPVSFLKKLTCTLGDYEFHVDPYGKMFFCCLMEPFGHLNALTAPQAWNSPQAARIREKVHACRTNCHIMVNCFYEDENISGR